MDDIRAKYEPKEVKPKKNIFGFIFKNKWKILLFLVLILIFVFPEFSAKVIGVWFNSFFSTLIKYSKFW